LKGNLIWFGIFSNKNLSNARANCEGKVFVYF